MVLQQVLHNWHWQSTLEQVKVAVNPDERTQSSYKDSLLTSPFLLFLNPRTPPFWLLMQSPLLIQTLGRMKLPEERSSCSWIVVQFYLWGVRRVELLSDFGIQVKSAVTDLHLYRLKVLQCFPHFYMICLRSSSIWDLIGLLIFLGANSKSTLSGLSQLN